MDSKKTQAMKTVIAGSRGITDYNKLKEAVDRCGFVITEVVSGGARGVDQMGERWAREHNIPIKQFIPDWNKHGKAAGLIRNVEMSNYAEAVIVLWDGSSRGSKHMYDTAIKKGLTVHLEMVIYGKPNELDETGTHN
jgi:hypothetical protein